MSFVLYVLICCRPLYEVYGVRLDSEAPPLQFYPGGSLALDGLITDSNSYSCARSMFIIHCDRGPLLWNWEQDSWIQLVYDRHVVKVTESTSLKQTPLL
jgi:hypothetical protein